MCILTSSFPCFQSVSVWDLKVMLGSLLTWRSDSLTVPGSDVMLGVYSPGDETV